MTSLPDVNVLIYAVDSEALHHKACHQWLEEALDGAATVAFAWTALLGFVRITTNPRIMKSPLGASVAFDYVEDWLANPRSRVVHPSSQHTATFRRLVTAVGTAGNLSTDAHLAAIAIDHEVEIVSCDSDFGKFQGVRWFNPVTGARVR